MAENQRFVRLFRFGSHILTSYSHLTRLIRWLKRVEFLQGSGSL